MLHTLVGASTIILMKHKHIQYMWYSQSTRIDGANAVVIKKFCDDLRICRCIREWEAAKDQGSFKLQTSRRAEAVYSVKGAIYSSR